MNFFNVYNFSFWLLGSFELIALILLTSHHYSSFNISVSMLTSFFAALLGYSLMKLYENQQKFGKIFFVFVHIFLTVLFFFFFKNHLHNYVLEDSGMYFYYPLIGIFLSTFFLSAFGGFGKSQDFFRKQNAINASSFGNSLFFATLISIGIILVTFSTDILFWNNIYKGGFGVKVYLSLLVGVMFSIFGYNFFYKNYEINNLEKSNDTKQFLKLYFPVILIFLIFLALNILLIIKEGKIQNGSGIFIIIFLLLWLGYYVINFPGKKNINIAFWLASIGLGGFLIYITGLRVETHGLSVNRYWSILLGGFMVLAGISSIFFNNLKIILSLSYVTIILGFFSPFNGLKLSEKDQLKRIENILVKEGILVGTDLQQPQKNMSNEKKADLLLRIQNYIYNYGSKGLLPWLKSGNAASKGDAINDFSDQTGIKRGFESYKNPENENYNTTRPYDTLKNFEFDSSDYWNVRGYELAFRFKADNTNPLVKYDKNAIRLVGNNIRIFYNEKTYNLDLNSYIKSISNIKNTENIIPSFSISEGEYYFTIVFSNLQINTTQDIINTIDAMVFVKKI